MLKYSLVLKLGQMLKGQMLLGQMSSRPFQLDTIPHKTKHEMPQNLKGAQLQPVRHPLTT